MATKNDTDSSSSTESKTMDESQQNIDPKQQAGKLRSKVVDELLSTEKTYVSCLDNLIRHFMVPLQSKINGKLFMSTTDHSTIFPSDINTIYGFHTQLLVELAKTTSNWNNDTSKIGNIFVKYGQLFKMYQNYMNNHEKASICLSKIVNKNTKFADWCSKARDKCNNYGLESLLILPIQRIPRYQLLLKELIKRTEQYDEYHCDLYDLRNAFDQITEVTQCINDRMKENDRREKVGLIESRFDRSLIDKIGENLVIPARTFVAESSDDPNDEDYIIKHDKHGKQTHIVIFVFNDCMIYGHYENNTVNKVSSPTVTSSKSGKKRASLTPIRPQPARKSITVKTLFGVKSLLKFDHMMSFDDLFRLEDVAEDKYNNLFCLKVYARQHSLWISFSSKQCKFKWMTLLIETNDKSNSKTIKAPINTPYDIDIPYPAFIPDDYSERCLICKSKFTMLNRRHHCYYCGILACGTCTDFRLTNAWKQNEIVRVCTSCHNKYKDKSGDVPATNLPSNHRASVWEASTAIMNLRNGGEDTDSNLVPIISPSASPVAMLANNTPNTPPPIINNQMGTASAINGLINQQQTRRASLRRRKMSDNKNNMSQTDSDQDRYLNVESSKEATSPSISFEIIKEENTAETVDTDKSIVEIKSKEISVQQTVIDNDDKMVSNDKNMVVSNDDSEVILNDGGDQSLTHLIVNDEYFNTSVISQVEQTKEKEEEEKRIEIEVEEMKHESKTNLTESVTDTIDEVSNMAMEDEIKFLIDDDRQQDIEQEQNNMLIIGGIVVIGIALIVALNRKRLFL